MKEENGGEKKCKNHGINLVGGSGRVGFEWGSSEASREASVGASFGERKMFTTFVAGKSKIGNDTFYILFFIIIFSRVCVVAAIVPSRRCAAAVLARAVVFGVAFIAAGRGAVVLGLFLLLHLLLLLLLLLALLLLL